MREQLNGSVKIVRVY